MKTVSIVINTLNRAADLARAIESFRWLDARAEFEVIVVNGPSTDGTDAVLASWSDKVRSYRCDVPNLSVSRNIGIAAASGDVVAFIDDDGIPEPEWLDNLALAYEDETVGAAGGYVYNHTGYDFQYRFGTADRLGNADVEQESTSQHLNFPFSFNYPHLLGTNSSFRRSALIEIGGFDEEFEYFLDETDVMVRLIDAGFAIRQLSNAFVHHKFAPSHLRDTNRVTKNRYPILKNKVYFCLKHGRPFVGMAGVLKATSDFFDLQRREIAWLVGQGLATSTDAEVLEEAIDRATADGMSRGLANKVVLLPPEGRADLQAPFLRFPLLDVPDRMCIVFVSGDYPPNRTGGIATFTSDLARALAALGHTVHVITRSLDINRVDFETGVWVHRMVPRTQPRDHDLPSEVPAGIWNWSATAREEAHRIASHRRIDCVETPIWDCEGIAFLLEGAWPTAVSLQTTFSFWLDSNPHKLADEAFMRDIGTPMLELERVVLQRAHAIRAISAAIRHDIEGRYRLTLPDERVMVLPLGIEDRSVATQAPTARGPADQVEVAFVGRLEKRKGIDTLLASVPLVLERCPNATFRIVGDDTLTAEDGRTYRAAYEDSAGEEWERVQFDGRLDDAALEAVYAHCDVFVAPSRYESFGLVYVEAMRAGKPSIGCKVGGVPEVVVDGSTGLLVPPGDVVALAEALIALIEDPDLRAAMGGRARQRFEECFRASQTPAGSIALYRSAIRQHGRRQ